MSAHQDNPPQTEEEIIKRDQISAVMQCLKNRPRARYASTRAIHKTIVTAYMDPPPCKQTLIDWFRRASIPCINDYGRGRDIYWQVAAAENFI